MELSLANLENVLERINGNTLSLGNVSWIEPVCISLLQSRHKYQGINFTDDTNFTQNVQSYLDRIFSGAVEQSRTYYPIENITTRLNLDVIAKRIASTIIKRDDFSTLDRYTDFTDYLKYVLTEIMNNVADHSESQIGGYVTGQYYPLNKKVQIAISDAGNGFLHKLSRKFNDVFSEEDAINKAVQKEVTGSLPDIYGAERNAGYGLYVISKIVEVTGGTLKIVSNNTITTFYDGTIITKVCDTDWKGSIVAFEILTDFIDSTLMDFLTDRIYVEEVEEFF